MRLLIIVGLLVFLAVMGLACTQTESTPDATRPPTSVPTASPTPTLPSPIAADATPSESPKVSPPAATPEPTLPAIAVPATTAAPPAATVEPTLPAMAVPAATPGPTPTATPGSPLTPTMVPMTKQVVEAYVLEGRSLSMADLKGLNLSDADLFNGHFQEANLSGTNLQNTRLMFAILRGADLSNANLRGANLRFADLTGANLTGADLSGTDLREAILRNANLSQVDLSETILVSANLHGADLTKANLSGSQWDASICEPSGNLGRFCTSEELLNAGAYLCSTGNRPLLISPANSSDQTRPSINFDWSDCAGAPEYQLQIQAPGGWTADILLRSSSYQHVSNELDACCSWSWKVRASVGGRWDNWSAIRTYQTVQTVPSGAPISPLPLEGTFRDEFVEQPTYTGDCLSPPAGTTCIGFNDGYIWLVDELIQGKRAIRIVSTGTSVETELGAASEFLHILRTSLVKREAR